MIITKCAWCAKQLEHKAPRCGNCKTRYCSRECQKQHWKKGDHKTLCPLIKRGGGAEQYHADKKYKEVVAVAVEKCAEETKGQTCFICTEGAERRHKTNEGLVSAYCACRGTSGYAHVSCLVRQAQVAVEEAEYKNLKGEELAPASEVWYRCRLCRQQFHGVVREALGWAAWRTYVDRPEEDWCRDGGMLQLGNGLCASLKYEEALEVNKVLMASRQRTVSNDSGVLGALTNIAFCYSHLDRHEEALAIRRQVYVGKLRYYHEGDPMFLPDVVNLGNSLIVNKCFSEAREFMAAQSSLAEQKNGADNEYTLRLRMQLARAHYRDDKVTLDGLRVAAPIMEDVHRRYLRIYGDKPFVKAIEEETTLVRCMRNMAEKHGIELIRSGKYTYQMAPMT